MMKVSEPAHREVSQTRRCARDSGRNPPSEDGPATGPRSAAGFADCPSSAAVSVATVWKVKTVRTLTCRACAMRAAVRLWPPSSNRFASGSVTGRSRICAHTSATCCSAGVNGRAAAGDSAAARASSGAGSARRSSLPPAATGRAGRYTKAAGIM